MAFSQVSLYSLAQPSSHVASSLLNEFHQPRRPVRPIVSLTKQGKIEYDARRPFVHDPSFSCPTARLANEIGNDASLEAGCESSLRIGCPSQCASLAKESQIVTHTPNARAGSIGGRINVCEAVLASLQKYTQDYRRINETRETLRRLKSEQADLDFASL